MTKRPPDFDNTQIAFHSRSTAELRKAWLLFQSFAYPTLISVGPKLVNLALSLRLPVTPIIKATIFEQFCGGQTLEACDPTIRRLAKDGIRSIPDFSVEGLGTEAAFEETVEEVSRVIAKAKDDPSILFAVFKVTGLARFGLLEKASTKAKLTADEKAELKRVEERVYRLCREARDAGRRLLIDAEESWIQPIIDDLVVAMMREFNQQDVVVYNTFQMYRHDRLAYIRELIEVSAEQGYKVGIKLVRGAYMEKERARATAQHHASPIQKDKAATDRDFNKAVELAIENIDRVALFAGSHNEESNRLLAELIDRKGLRRDDPRVEFSQLLGMSDNLTYNLADAGYKVSKYLPYGPIRAVFPYLVRRAEENSSIKGQAGRELQLIDRELKRRSAAR
jgi:proline dehydrogenase